MRPPLSWISAWISAHAHLLAGESAALRLSPNPPGHLSDTTVIERSGLTKFVARFEPPLYSADAVR